MKKITRRIAAAIIILAVLVGFAGVASAQMPPVNGGDDHWGPQYDRQYVDGWEYVFQAKPVAPTEICGSMPLLKCADSSVGRAYYAYKMLLGRDADVSGLQHWSSQNVSYDTLTEMFLGSPEYQSLNQQNDYMFAGTLLTRAYGGDCYVDMCWGTDQVMNAISMTEIKLVAGETTRSELARNVLNYAHHIGVYGSNFALYVDALRLGFDRSEFTLIAAYPPYNPCDPYGYTPEASDDCTKGGGDELTK